MARDGTKTGGRQKGSQNKDTKAIREMIIQALDEVGGVAYLVKQADLNPTAFMSLIAKVMPMQVVNDPDQPFEIKIIREYIGTKNTATS